MCERQRYTRVVVTNDWCSVCDTTHVRSSIYFTESIKEIQVNYEPDTSAALWELSKGYLYVCERQRYARVVVTNDWCSVIYLFH